MTRQIYVAITAILIVLSSTFFPVFGVIKNFNYSCNLQKHADLDAATFPSFSNIKSLRFKVSHRVTHELTTRVFAIFLREMLDFDKPIELDTYEEDRWKFIRNLPEDKYQEYYVMDDLSKTSSAMIDLEVWRTADNRESNINNVYEANSLSTNDVFRFGLYVPEVLVQNRKITFKNFIADGDFRDGSYEASKEIFDLSREIYMTKLARYTENITSGDVKSGIYDPHRCDSVAEPCAIILTSHFFDTIFFTRVVDALNMKVKIYFLGDNLKRKIKDFSDAITNNRSKKIFLVLHWTPSEITVDGSVQYTSIDLPKCEVLKNLNSSISCKFDANTVSIFFNDELKKSSPAFESLLYNVRFKSLKKLIEMYDERYLPKIDSKKKVIPSEIILPKEKGQTIDDIYNEIACKYLQNETEYYDPHGNSWLSDDNDITIYVGGIYPNDNSGQEYDGIQASRMIAAEEFQSLHFDRYKLQIENEQTDCKPDLALKSFIKHFGNREHLIGVLGPPCSEAIEPIAIISKHYKMSAITYSAEGISFADRSNYPYFFRTIGENSQYEDVFAKLFPHLGWERIAAITEDGQKYTEYISRMESNNNTFKIIVNRKFPRETNEKRQLEHFEKLLNDLKETNRARIIICDIHDHVLMKSIMCLASKIGMTAKEGFVWFLPVYISLKLNETTLLHTNETCTAADLKEILNGHFALAHANFGNETDIIPMNFTVGEWKQKYIQKRGISAISPSDYAPFVYDTIWVYAKALKELIDADSPENETTKHWYMKNLDKEKTLIKLSEIIGNMSFTGVTGKIEFNKAGSRYTIINILQWQNNDFTLVGTYKPIIVNKESNDGELEWIETRVKWLTRKAEIPDDGRESCLFKFLADAECQTINSVMIATSCVLIILACSGFSFLFWKHKYAKKLEESAQIMTNYGLVVNGIELSRWEIPRENVIINRRIGEGQFGTVYGGEALVKESEGWMPVAIKTLKAGAIADARLDFLGESETMKRFDHKNIVKLIAVCLQKEPLFMLSEFMLYGDLKTFLLARRHLVDDKINDDSNDISPKRLTLMALDIARGLSYLASLNYVHRDLACRNCLINAQRICKIGDFGMARSTCENEYYRFTRKGMLPVRWMSPESISTGRFSHSSDVWAYAVFLYEVVTLGGFPFQGLNNNQVFDFVKAGGCVKIPSNCKPPLRALMSSCFSIDTKKRPGASTIVEFISAHPKMLTVCMMDAPKPNLDEQVNLLENDNEDFEFDQLAETRERSHTPAATVSVDFLRTSSSSSALQIQNRNQEFDYLDMKLPLQKLPRRLNGIYNHQTPDLTATLPNGNYNPIEPLLQPRSEISKSTMSLLKMYVPMCGKNRNRSSTEECTTPI